MILFSDQGEVFGWGNSEYGQFRMVTEEQQINHPVKLSLKGIGKIIDIASGGTICMVLNGNNITRLNCVGYYGIRLFHKKCHLPAVVRIPLGAILRINSE